MDAAGVARDGSAHGDALCIVGIEARDGGCAEHAQDGDVHRDTDVHGARVRRDKEGAPPQKPRERAELYFPGKEMQMRMRPLLHLRNTGVYNLDVHGAAHHGDMIAACEIAVGDGSEITGLPAFRPPARTDIERDDPIPGGQLRRPQARSLFLRCGRQPHLQPRVVDRADDARIAQRRVVRVNLVHDLILIGAYGVKCEGKARLCISDDAPPARECGERRGAFVAVEIDDEVVFFFPQLHRKAEDTEEAVVLPFFIDEETAIDMPVLAHDVGEQEVGEEGDARGGVIVPKRAQDGRHEHEVAEVHEVDDEDVFVHAPSVLCLHIIQLHIFCHRVKRVERAKDKPKPPFEDAALQDVKPKERKRRIEQHFCKRAGLARRMLTLCHQRRILVEFLKIAIPARICVVIKLARKPPHGQLRTGTLMDKPLPANGIAREKPQAQIGTMPAITHFLPKGDIDTLDLIGSLGVLLRDAAHRLPRRRTDALVRIQIEHPIRRRLRECKVALCGKVPRERVRNNARSRLCRDLTRQILALIVNHEDLIGERRTPDARADMGFLIVRENNHRDFHKILLAGSVMHRRK